MTNRRNFFSVSTAAAALGMTQATLPAASAPGTAISSSKERRQQAFRLRMNNAMEQRDRPWSRKATNGDTQRYPSGIASFTKTLPHDANGEVDPGAFAKFLAALESGRGEDFAAIPMGGTAKLADPQAAYAFDLVGADSHQVDLRPAPAFASAEAAGEMTEVYWQALTRDIPFADYSSNPLIGQAIDDLNRLSDFRGPKVAKSVTAGTLFRGLTPGDLKGPYLSQFLAKTIPFGAGQMPQQYVVPQAAIDFMTSPSEWLAIQNGIPPFKAFAFDSTARYIRNGRDLSWFVRQDFSYQAYLAAALILLSYGGPALSPNNYYLKVPNQGGFITFGAPNVLDCVATVANAALRAAWCQKWLLHLRLRPEVYAARVQQVLIKSAKYPVHADVLNSSVVQLLASANGSYLLPMAYPEGSPAHPSYPAGHAAIAGACVTVLKAFFNENFAIPSPVVASSDGLKLLPYSGSLTVGDELNKLAANISLGRDTAGVHYRSDGIEGMRLGEEVAIAYLRDIATTYHEDFNGFSFTRFDGTPKTICPNC